MVDDEPLPPKRRPGRPPGAKNKPRPGKKQKVQMMKMNLNLDPEDYARVQDIARLETMAKGRFVSVTALIRNAVNYIYKDEMLLREVFRFYRGRGSTGPRKRR